MRRNRVNKWAWRKCFRFSTTFCVQFSGVSAVCDGVSAYRKRLALECAHIIGLYLRNAGPMKNVNQMTANRAPPVELFVLEYSIEYFIEYSSTRRNRKLIIISKQFYYNHWRIRMGQAIAPYPQSLTLLFFLMRIRKHIMRNFVNKIHIFFSTCLICRQTALREYPGPSGGA